MRFRRIAEGSMEEGNHQRNTYLGVIPLAPTRSWAPKAHYATCRSDGTVVYSGALAALTRFRCKESVKDTWTCDQ
eukprot:2625486-Pyramimonas_sp.AAC.1